MALSEHDAEELLELLSEAWDRGATPERIQAIEGFARTHGPAASEKIVEFASLHSEIAASLSSARAHSAALSAVLATAEAREEGRHLQSARRDGSSRRTAPARARRLLGWASLAAAVMLAAGWITQWQGEEPACDLPPEVTTALVIERPRQPVACIVSETNTVWRRRNENRTVKQGQDLKLEAGFAHLSLACGADIVLQGPCHVTLVSEDRVQLNEGALMAQVATWATGFVVETKSLRVTDLGTRFIISANSDGVSEAHVLEGSVLAQPKKSVRPNREPVLLSDGQGIRVSLPKSTIDLIAAKETALIDHLRSFRPLQAVEIWNTGLGQRVGSDDSHWMIVDGDPAAGPYPRPAVVTKGVPVYLDNMPDASQWITISADQMAASDSVTTFETKFDLTGFDLSTVRIVGLFLVDDAINSLKLNGTDVPFDRWESSWDVQDFQRFRAIEFADGFLPGENVISVGLYNSASHPNPGLPNPVGMRVEWQAFGSKTPWTAVEEEITRRATAL